MLYAARAVFAVERPRERSRDGFLVDVLLSSSDKAAAASLIRFRSISLCVSSESDLNSITESNRAKIGAPSLSRASSAEA